MDKVDTKIHKMSPKKQRLELKLERLRLQKEVYEMIRVHHQSVREVMEKTGLKKGTVYHYLYTFESDNPEVAEQMKKRGTEITPMITRNFRRRMPAFWQRLSVKNFVQTSMQK